MPLTNKKKQDALRKRRAKLGLKRREFSLTDYEFIQVKKIISDFREQVND